MSYESTSIKKALERVHQQHLLLPAIQRNFVWGAGRIESYFDSVMRGYPLGNFIWWKLDKALAKKYPFYRFLTHFHQRDNTQNERAQEHIYSNDMWGVLDGQQRLSALYLGITGSLTYKNRGRGHWSKDYNFEQFKLYVNLLYNPRKSDEEKEENPMRFGFKFITEKHAQEINDKQLWFKVGDVFDCDSEEDILQLFNESKQRLQDIADPVLQKKFEQKEREVLENLLHFFVRFQDHELLHYFKVEERELDEVLNIFVRVNNGGMVLSKSQLMLATLSGTWAPARDKVEEIVRSLRLLGLNIDNDFVMRSALTLSDLPVLFKVGTFTTKNVERVVSDWEDIKDALVKTAEFLKEQSLLHNKFELISKNAIIPISYYIKKGGDLRSAQAKRNLRKYFVISQVKGIFGSQGDGVLGKLRDSLRYLPEKNKSFMLKQRSFSYDELLKISFSGNKSFKIDEDFIHELVDMPYSSQAYFILSLLYPNIDYEKNLLDMDHIHPFSSFSKANLKRIGIEREEEYHYWTQHGNSLANLQLLTTKVNNTKRAKPLKNYLDLLEAEQKGSKSAFIKDNFLPKTSYELSNFIVFHEKRRDDMIFRLNKVFA